MQKGEIPWIYNEAFEPHHFSFTADESQPMDMDEEEAASPEAEDYRGFTFEVF